MEIKLLKKVHLLFPKTTEKEETEFFFDQEKLRSSHLKAVKIFKRQTILQAWLPNVNHPKFI